jgi:hypothetical protein
MTGEELREAAVAQLDEHSAPTDQDGDRGEQHPPALERRQEWDESAHVRAAAP